jgi:hypothetical protein
MRRFRSSAPKAKNGFMARRIVSSDPARRNNMQENSNEISRMFRSPINLDGIVRWSIAMSVSGAESWARQPGAAF